MLDVPAARSLLRRTRPQRSADGYPPEVRALVTALARSLLASGQTRNAVAHQLGVHGGTLRRWLQLPSGPDSAVVRGCARTRAACPLK